MQSVEILPYQTGILSAPAFQNGAVQDQQTKSAEPVRWRVSALESHSTDFPYSLTVNTVALQYIYSYVVYLMICESELDCHPAERYQVTLFQ